MADLKSHLKPGWHVIGAAALVALLGVIFWGFVPTEGIERFSYDLPFGLRRAVKPDQALIVYMDESARINLHQPEAQTLWDRNRHTQLLNKLTALHAKAVVFDVWFADRWTNRAVDEQFAAAMKASGRVVLGATWARTGGSGVPVQSRLLHADYLLGSNGQWGVAEVAPDPADNVVREQFAPKDYPTLAQVSATLAGYSAEDQTSERWLNYYGPEGTVPQIRYDRILESDVANAVVSNKIVFVGWFPVITSTGRSEDEFPTPYSRWGDAKYPGVEIQATACLNLLCHDWLTRLPFPVEMGLVVVVAPVLGLLLSRRSLGVAWLLGGVFSVIFAAAAILLQQRAHLWFNWAEISFLQIPLALAIVRPRPERVLEPIPLKDSARGGAESEVRPGTLLAGNLPPLNQAPSSTALAKEETLVKDDRSVQRADPTAALAKEEVWAKEQTNRPPAQDLPRPWPSALPVAGAPVPLEDPIGMEAHAIFISYASEDEVAANTLAEGLEAAGIPVWLDKKKIKGGHDYEMVLKIAVTRRCSLFVSLISQTTEMPGSKRFVHKERKWAAGRHVDGLPFYIPVVIDTTADNAVKREPPCFSKIHRFRLPDGRVTPEFCESLRAWRAASII